MKIKYRSIEFFGVSGCGKSHLRKIAKRNLESKGFKVYDTREIIVKFIDKLIPLKFTQKLDMLFFKMLLLINIKTSFWNNALDKISKIYVKHNFKKFFFYKKKIGFLYNYNNAVSKENTRIWLDELIISLMIFNKIKHNYKNIIYFPDESFMQRLMLLTYSKKNINLDLIVRYLKNKIFCDKIVYVRASRKKIYQIHKNRKLNQMGWGMSSYNLKKMFNLNSKIINLIPFRYITFKNSYSSKVKFLADAGMFL